MSEQVRNSRRLPSLRWFLFASLQFLAGLSAAVVIQSFLPLSDGLGSLVGCIFAWWVDWVRAGFEFAGLGESVTSIAAQQIIVIGLLLLVPTVLAFFRPSLNLVVEGYSTISSSFSWNFVAGLWRLIGAVVTSFARFVVAPLLFGAVTVNLTWNIHMWMFDNYGQNAAITSIVAVFAATCLLLALGLERLIPR